MTKPFTGFSTDRQKTVRVPEGFFEDVLPQITSMLEMKVTLHLFWRLARAGREASSGSNGAGPHTPRMVSLGELAEDAALRSALVPNKGPRPVQEALAEGLELAVARGTLLHLRVQHDTRQGEDDDLWFLLNTRDNRAWAEAATKGEINVAHTPLARFQTNGTANGPGSGKTRVQAPNSKIIMVRPSVYALYEQNIGLLTPLLAERLQDAEGRYPREWMEDAFREAVVNNKRNWRYIERILERWAAEGKDSGKDWQGSGRDNRDARGLDPDKYTKGKYAFLFKPDR